MAGEESMAFSNRFNPVKLPAGWVKTSRADRSAIFKKVREAIQVRTENVRVHILASWCDESEDNFTVAKYAALFNEDYSVVGFRGVYVNEYIEPTMDACPRLGWETPEDLRGNYGGRISFAEGDILGFKIHSTHPELLVTIVVWLRDKVPQQICINKLIKVGSKLDVTRRSITSFSR